MGSDDFSSERRRRLLKRALSVAVGAAMLAVVPVPTATAAPPAEEPIASPRVHDLSSPLSDKQRELRAEALEQVVSGEATPSGPNQVVEVSKGKFVELAQEDSDAIWTVLGEFGDLPHNTIPAPDRTVDNTTIWTEDFSSAYFEELLHSSEAGVNSVANYYEELSSGRYTVTGEVEDWVTVDDQPAAYYGEADNFNRTSEFIDETLQAWWDEQIAAGMTAEEIDAYLSQFDVWDRYDQDGDGNFDEADGYIDHFQSVHAGTGEEVGGGVLGVDAIWSHRGYNVTVDLGDGGPTVDGVTVPLGGAPVGGSRYWVGDYTVEPENGGVGVFAHEFGHDLGLPDLYDTSGNTGGAENSTGFWTLMSSGSYGSSGLPEEGVGTRPIHMGAWEKLQLGWLNHKVVKYQDKATVRLGPAEYNTRGEQAVVVELPEVEVTTELGTPFEGTDFWYSGSDDNLDNSMLTPLPAGATAMTAQVNYQIEQDWDYAYAVYSTDDGATFTSIPTDRSTSEDPNGQNFGYGITGSTEGAWVPLTADLTGVPAGALVGFRYWTDGAAVELGFMVDAVDFGSGLVEDWTLNGFTESTGTQEDSYFNAYIAENRTYIGYDASLRTGPYNFGFPESLDLVEHLPYQNGLLISYWNSRYRDNNVGEHPGGGLVLPVDAHVGLLYEPTDDEGPDLTDGESWRPRLQSYDATFGLEPTDTVTLHDPETGVAGTYGGLPPVPTFDDRMDWYVAPGEQADADGWTGVDVPKTGTTITVQDTSGAEAMFMNVRIN
jgi:immune inhibitor A